MAREITERRRAKLERVLRWRQKDLTLVLANIHPSVLPAISGLNIVDKRQAVGIVETWSVAACISAADRAVKAANVTLIGSEKIGSGLVSIMVRGDVGAVKAAVEAGGAAASRLGEVIATHVIPRPHGDVEKLLPVLK